MCFSGWLNVRIPRSGLTVRKHLLDILGAEALVAGTYIPFGYDDDGDSRTADCIDGSGGCLLPRIQELRADNVTLFPMVTRRELAARLDGAPTFRRVKAAHQAAGGSNVLNSGVSIYSPVLGDSKLSVLRELLGYSRCHTMLREREAQRGARYERVVWSRIEYDWLANHPPLAVLPPCWVWVPSAANGVSIDDGHAVLSRSAADTYLRRWELLFQPDVIDRMGLKLLSRARRGVCGQSIQSLR